jgi:hypothetical protein
MNQNMAYMLAMMNAAMNKNTNGNNQNETSPIQMKIPVPFFNPFKATSKDKNFLAAQTMGQTIAGAYASFPKLSHVPFSFAKSYEPPEPMGICEVLVVNDHILDVVEQYSEKGRDYEKTKNNGMNPITVNVVGREFNGTNFEMNEEMRDELFNIRTTYSNNFSNTKFFPLKKDECTYLKIVSVIRPSFPMPNSFLPHHLTFRTALVTIAPIKVNTKNYIRGSNILDGKMNPNDFVDTLTLTECIFQLAILKQHPVLILPPFGHNDIDNNPVDDVIKIYNYCIYKYGHVFKKIIIAIPKFYPKEILNKYQEKIVNPTAMVTEIDKKYEKEETKQQLIQSSKINKKISTEQSLQPAQLTTPQLTTPQSTTPQFTPEQLEFIKNMMANMAQ